MAFPFFVGAGRYLPIRNKGRNWGGNGYRGADGLGEERWGKEMGFLNPTSKSRDLGHLRSPHRDCLQCARRLCRCQAEEFPAAPEPPGSVLRPMLKMWITFALYSPILIPCSICPTPASATSRSAARAAERTSLHRSSPFQTHGLWLNVRSATIVAATCLRRSFAGLFRTS